MSGTSVYPQMFEISLKEKRELSSFTVVKVIETGEVETGEVKGNE